MLVQGCVRQAPPGHSKEGRRYSVGSQGTPGASGWTGTQPGVCFKQVSLGVNVELAWGYLGHPGNEGGDRMDRGASGGEGPEGSTGAGGPGAAVLHLGSAP